MYADLGYTSTGLSCPLLFGPTPAPETHAKPRVTKARCLFVPVYPVYHHPDLVLVKVVSDTLSDRPWAPFLAGAAAGIIGWMAPFPFDVLKTRLQAERAWIRAWTQF
jgi:hypothetical protein